MFSYTEYKNLIKYIQDYLPIVDFADVTEKTKKFCLLRHDIEYSIDRAVQLAMFEAKELGVTSTYAVQVRNNIYNAISNDNIKKIHKIKSLGHKIALHINPPIMPMTHIKDYILRDIETLENYYNFEIDRYSYHIPKKEYLKEYIEIDGKINCYGKEFFHFFEGEKPKDLRVLYLADSNHQWKYGYPLDFDLLEVNKLQLLVHPYSWTPQGYENFENIHTLVSERNKELAESMSEIKSFPKEFLL